MQRMWRACVRALLICALLLMSAGCGQDLTQLDFEPVVTVDGDTATVAVTITGSKNINDIHVHLFLDGGPEIMMYADTYTYRNLAAGEHTLAVELAGDDHQPLAGQRKVVTFTVPATTAEGTGQP